MSIMCNKLKIILLVSVLLFGASKANIANATIINLNALSNTTGNPISRLLTKGTYDVTPIGTADGGAYNGWNPWGTTNGCDSSGANCAHGWFKSYSLSSSQFDAVTYRDSIRYANPSLDLANAINSSFTLSIDTTVDFFLTDQYVIDNVGGVSLSVTAVPGSVTSTRVPEPSTMLLLGSGLFGVVALRKKIKKN